MLNSIILDFHRRLMILNTSIQTSSSYIIFDYLSPFTNVNDRVVIHIVQNHWFLSYNTTDPATDAKSHIEKELPPYKVENLFQWLKSRFSNHSTVFRARIGTDPTRLRLFAFDAKVTWKCSIVVLDTQRNEDLRPLRAEFMTILDTIIFGS